MKQVSKSIPFGDILEDKQARRVGSSVESIDALKKSIGSLGLLDPMIVEGLPGNKYRLCAGRNRYIAIKSLIEDDEQNRFDEVPCTVLEFDDHELMDENYKNYKISQVIFDSNDKRSQLTKFEQARHYAAQKHQFPHLFPTDAELAKFNNKPVNEVVEAMRLLALNQKVVDRVEELNLQNPGTIPFMCLEEIAEAAALPKRPLPPEGQIKVVDLLTSPDLGDKRALVARDKMKALVTAIRKEYAPDPRGRKKSEPQPLTPSDEQMIESLFGGDNQQSSDQETSTMTEEVYPTEGDNNPQSGSLVREDAFGAPTEEDSHKVLSDITGARRNGSSHTEATPIVANSGSSDIPDRLPAGANSPTLVIVDLNIDNAISVLRKGLPTLTQEQYTERALKLEELRRLLESAAFSLA